MNENHYLGDGLYAAFDGYQIRLWTQREDGVHEVFLNGAALDAFEAFVSSIREDAKRRQAE